MADDIPLDDCLPVCVSVFEGCTTGDCMSVCMSGCLSACVCVCVCVKAARRELEHQRQLEWERQRRDQLMAETQREHSHVDKLRLEIGQHKQELDIVVSHRRFCSICLSPSIFCSSLHRCY